MKKSGSLCFDLLLWMLLASIFYVKMESDNYVDVKQISLSQMYIDQSTEHFKVFWNAVLVLFAAIKFWVFLISSRQLFSAKTLMNSLEEIFQFNLSQLCRLTKNS